MTVSTVQSTAPAKLPVWQITAMAYRETFANFGSLMTLVALPASAAVLLEILVAEAGTDSLVGIPRFFLSLALLAIFEVVWLRFLLLRSGDGRPGLLTRPGRRCLPFLGYFFLLLPLYLPGALFEHIATNYAAEAPGFSIAVSILFYLLALYFNARFSFTFLWIAVDTPERLRASWRATRKNGLRLVIPLCLAAAPGLILPFALGALLSIVAPEVAIQFEAAVYETWLLLLMILIGIALLYFCCAVACSVLVQAFRHLTGWGSDQREILERFE